MTIIWVASKGTLTLTETPPEENKAAKAEWNPLHVDVCVLIEELSLGSLCLLLVIDAKLCRARIGREDAVRPWTQVSSNNSYNRNC